MNDNDIRVGILNFLKNIYDQNPHQYVQREAVLDTGEITEPELDRNIKYLEEKGLIDIQWFLGGSFLTKINSLGIDAIEQIHDQIQQEHTEAEISTDEVLPTLIDETKTYVDSLLGGLNPEIITKLNLAYDELLSRGVSHNFARIAYDCREILNDFTDALFSEDQLEDQEKRPARNKTKNKIYMLLRKQTGSETKSRLVSERYDYIISYFDLLSDTIQKNAHPDNFEVTLEDAKTCLIYTYLFMRDILRILEPEWDSQAQ